MNKRLLIMLAVVAIATAVLAPVIARAGDLAALLTNLQPRDVLQAVSRQVSRGEGKTGLDTLREMSQELGLGV